MDKHVELSTIFYRKFFLLIVIPILVIILVSIGIIQGIMMKSSLEKIELAQKNVKTTLENEILDSSLRLSHFLLTNDSQVLEYIAEYNMSNNEGKYIYNLKLQERFNLMLTPKTDILDISFHMKDGGQYSLKDDLAMPSEYIRNAGWYQKALDRPKYTYIGSEKTNIILSHSNRISPKLALVVAFSPANFDRYRQVEMVCMYVASGTTQMITDYNKDLGLGEMYIIDGSGNILSGIEKQINEDILKNSLAQEAGTYSQVINNKRFKYIIKTIEATDWKMVNIVETNKLLSVFHKISLGIMSMAIVLFILFFMFSRMFLKNIINPVANLVYGMELMEQGDLYAHVQVDGVGEIRKLVHSFNRMARQIKELILSNEQKEKEKHQEEIKALQSQINPHFLVNTLNSIRFMAIVAKFDSIKNMAEALTKIVACSFKGENSFYTIREEIEMLESYVYLMKIRYSDNFEVDFQVDSSCLDYKVPRLSIQPILENSIIHGFEDMDDIGQITIKVYEKHNQVIFQIEDNGQGMTQEVIEMILSDDKKHDPTYRGIGVSNVNRRIQLNYGEKYGITINSELGKYTHATIRIPIQREEMEDV